MKDIELVNQTPGQLAESRIIIADQYGKLGERKVELLRIRALYYESFRQDVKSDAALERRWELTKEGLELMEVSMKLKSKEYKMSAIKSLLDTKNFEARNQY
jgi:hypothetical protein